MKKSIFFSFILLFATYSLLSQTYHNDDKEGIRIFLRQPSTVSGEINAEQIGLTLSDTATWYADENWITKIPRLIWNNSTPKRLDSVRLTNKLTGILDAGKWTEITYLNCQSSKITSLNVSSCPNLENLNCNFVELTSLDISNCSNLVTLECTNNQFSNLATSSCPNLVALKCYYNQLTNLDISNCPYLTTLECSNNQLTSLDVNSCPNLILLSCDNNQLTSLDVTNNPYLKIIRCINNQITSLDVSTCPELVGLDCLNNQLQSLTMGNHPKLAQFNCGNNQLQSLNVSDCPNLFAFYCDTNQLQSLDVSNCTILQFFECQSNQIRELDLSNCADLYKFNCSNNQLQSLDISGCLDLYEYSCYNNQLPLSVLFAASTTTTQMGRKHLGTQNLPLKRVLVEDSLFAEQSAFVINSNTIYTTYVVIQNGNPAPTSSYSVNDGVIVFHDTGVYTVTMSNIAVVSSYVHPASVIVEISVVETFNTDACLADITVSAGTLSPAFDCAVSDYTVDVANNIDAITITATPNDPFAVISGDIGLQQLAVGENLFVITTTSEDEATTLQYTLTITRSNVGMVDANLQDNINIYPNPAQHTLYITSSETVEHVSIYDISGRTVGAYSIRPYSPSPNIDISNLANGIYLVKVKTTQGESIRKIVISD